MFSDSQTKASILNSQFSSVFNMTESLDSMKDKGISPHPSMTDIKVSCAGVFKLELDVHKAPGPDGLSPKLLKELAEELAPILTLLFQTSLQQGKIPDDWSTADVVPIFKSGEKSKAENYRPISLTCILCKTMEHIISSSIMHHLDGTNILTDAQHGFRKRRSCDTQLILAVQDLAKSLHDRTQSDVILLDFSKAFDKVPHARLLYKLTYYGITGTTHNWINDFLRKQTQRVVLEGSSSDVTAVTSGVPQGSVLDPQLFLVFINDLPEYVSENTTVRLFADDCKLYRRIQTHEDSSQLQEDLNSLQKWEQDWLMSFNPKKCQVLRIARKKTPVIFNYVIGNHTLDSPDTTKYLGVHLSQDLSWNNHINYIAKKASSTSAFLQRKIHACPRQTKVLCYKALVRPVMEYMPAQSGTLTHRKTSLSWRWFQRKYARFIFNNFQRTSSVSTMLNHLQWPSLQERRAQYKVVMVYLLCQQSSRYPANILPSCTSCNIKRIHPKVCHPFRKNLCFPAIFLPRFHWPMEFAAPGDSWLCNSRSVSTRCAAHATPPLMGDLCFLLAPAMHVV